MLSTPAKETNGTYSALVAFCTSREEKIVNIETGQFRIELDNSEAFQLTGLRKTTKVCLNNQKRLPLNDFWFSAPDFQSQFAGTPKLGVISGVYRDLASAAHGLLLEERARQQRLKQTIRN